MIVLILNFGLTTVEVLFGITGQHVLIVNIIGQVHLSNRVSEHRHLIFSAHEGELLDELSLQVIDLPHLYLLGSRHQPIGSLQHFLENSEDKEVVDFWNVLGKERIDYL